MTTKEQTAPAPTRAPRFIPRVSLRELGPELFVTMNKFELLEKLAAIFDTDHKIQALKKLVDAEAREIEYRQIAREVYADKHGLDRETGRPLK